MPADVSSRQIQVLQKDATSLKRFIDSLYAQGNTSIDVGMKWGTALLDPSLQPTINTLTRSGNIPRDFEQRPHAHNSGETLKVIVLMTDGENTSQYYVEPRFRPGASNIWWNAEEDRYSVYDGQDIHDRDRDGNRNEEIYYWPHEDEWYDHAYGNGTTLTHYVCRRYRRDGSCRRWRRLRNPIEQEENGTAVRLSYGELWAKTSIYYNMQEHYRPWLGSNQAYNTWYRNVFNAYGQSEKNTRTRNIYNQAKAQGIVVYSIGFEAPSNGRAVLRDCASSDSHYFDVSGLEVADAFSSIASSIRQLRLTQ